MTDDLQKSILQAKGREIADTVIRNVRIFHLTDGSIEHGDIAIADGKILGIAEHYDGKIVVDGEGCFAVPGFIDGHVHLESSMLTPYAYERCVLPHGTTSVVTDPHELANVFGLDAIRYYLDCAATSIMDFTVKLSSCVPATPLETSGATLNAKDLASLKNFPHASGLGEFMNFPGVLNQDPECLAKLDAFRNSVIDGHAPFLVGRDLCAYIGCGIYNCHEVTSCEEGAEKLRRGMRLLFRYGSATRNLSMLAPLLTPTTSPFIAFCTDDRNVLDLEEEGHIDGIIRRLIALGVEPIAAYRAASYSAAEIFQLPRKGLLIPGYEADIVLVRSLADCDVQKVIKKGRLVTSSLFAAENQVQIPPKFLNSIRCRPVTAADFSPSEAAYHHAMAIQPSLSTGDFKISPPLTGDFGARGFLKMAVIERHGKNNNIAIAPVKDFDLFDGALASTVAHDSHNLCVIGSDDESMAIAANRVIALKGGQVAVQGHRVAAEIALPVGGLISDRSEPELALQQRAMRDFFVKNHFETSDPLMVLSFLALPVIPHLKLTDKGLVDVFQQKFV